MYEKNSEEELYENISEEDNLILAENDKNSANKEDPWSFVRQPIEFIQSKVFAPSLGRSPTGSTRERVVEMYKVSNQAVIKSHTDPGY